MSLTIEAFIFLCEYFFEFIGHYRKTDDNKMKGYSFMYVVAKKLFTLEIK